MYKGETFWRSIDEIALAKGISLPRLALAANMDSSAFSLSRRDRHWISLHSIAKVLDAAGMSITEWAELVEKLNGEPTHAATDASVPAGPEVPLLP